MESCARGFFLMRIFVLIVGLLLVGVFMYVIEPHRYPVPPRGKERMENREQAQLEQGDFVEWQGNKKLLTFHAEKMEYRDEKIVGEIVDGTMTYKGKLIFTAEHAEYDKKSRVLRLQDTEIKRSDFILKAKTMNFLLASKQLKGVEVAFQREGAHLKAESFHSQLPLRNLVFEGNTLLRVEHSKVGRERV